MTNLERIKKFDFKGEEYQIEFPNIGQYMDIENQKIIQSDGQWLNLLKNQTVAALRAVQIIECVSVFKVLCSKLFKNMNVSSYREIDAIDFAELLIVYNNEIKPWYNAWFEQFNEVILGVNEKMTEEEE